MADYIKLLKGDIFEFFPEDLKDSDGEFRELADLINQFRDIIVTDGDPTDGTLSIEDMDLLFICHRIPARIADYVGQMFDAGIDPGDSDRVKRQKICEAVAINKLHATVSTIRTQIEDVTGFAPDILAFSAFQSGWDEDETVEPPTYTIDFNGGLFWDEDLTYLATYPDGTIEWSIIPTGILVDVKNDGAYTAEQWEDILTIVAKNKRADIAAEVGYFDSGTGEKVVYDTVYSENLAQDAWEDLADPGI